jgi:hypothetical protein
LNDPPAGSGFCPRARKRTDRRIYERGVRLPAFVGGRGHAVQGLHTSGRSRRPPRHSRHQLQLLPTPRDGQHRPPYAGARGRHADSRAAAPAVSRLPAALSRPHRRAMRSELAAAGGSVREGSVEGARCEPLHRRIAAGSPSWSSPLCASPARAGFSPPQLTRPPLRWPDFSSDGVASPARRHMPCRRCPARRTLHQHEPRRLQVWTSRSAVIRAIASSAWCTRP